MSIDINTTPLVQDELADHQRETDHRSVAIDKVGIRGLQLPIQFADLGLDEEPIATIATVEMAVNLPHTIRGTHMSRFVEIVNRCPQPLSFKILGKITGQMCEHLQSDSAYIKFTFDYFLAKNAPVSGIASLMNYQVTLEAQQTGSHLNQSTHVAVPVKTLCPCSKSISKYGAHSQRGVVHVSYRLLQPLSIQRVIAIVESSGSSDLFALLKRHDEKHITEKAYENPVFVEDLIRNVVQGLNQEKSIASFQVRAENQESIHNHNAFAETRTGPELQ